MRTLNTPTVLGIVLGAALGMMIVTYPVAWLIIGMFVVVLDHAFDLSPQAEIFVAIAVTYAAYVGVVSGILLILHKPRMEDDTPADGGF